MQMPTRFKPTFKRARRLAAEAGAAHRCDLARLEQLEPRILLSADPTIVAIDADNRGLVVIEVSADLLANTVDADAVKVFTAGRDGLLGTADDADANADVRYDAENDRIIVDAQNAVDPDERYSVFVDGDQIRGANGRLLDVEFDVNDGSFGNGAEGGELLIYTTPRDQSIARIETALGAIDVLMFNDQTPITVANFFRYANEGLYDTNFFHRSVEDFVVQGGGFDFADPDFDPIPTFEPILNEPGISNTRGTVAMAKLGGDPNSATSQWFFNLGDNSANLDDQNGGFTVFGEILNDEGLAVMDALAALQTIDASDIQSAFSDLPVRDSEIVPSELDPENLATITRVASLYELSAEPANQLGGQGNTSEIANPDGPGVVRVINLDGDDPGAIANYLDIRWGRDGDIRTLTLNDGFTGNIGIQITGVEEIRRFDDRRSERARGELSFISVQDGVISNLRLKQSLAGFDLNGATLPGGFVFPDDVDGDGRTSDPTALYFGGANDARVFRADADLTGDVVYSGALRSILVRGDVASMDFVVGQQLTDGPDQRPVSVNLRGGVVDVGVLSEVPISSIRADSWLEANADRHIISAPEIRTINVRGDLQVDGLRTTDAGVRSINVRGLVLSSNWDIAGDVRSMRLGDVSRLDLNVDGDLNVFRAGEATVSNLTVGGSSRVIIADEWDRGDVRIGGDVRVFRLADGGVTGNVVFNETSGDSAPRVIDIRGDARNGELKWTGEAARVSIRGDVVDFNVGGDDDREAGARRFLAGDVVDSDVNLFLGSRVFRVDSFTGGAEMVVLEAQTVTVFGDFDGTLTIADTRRFAIGGDARFENFDAGVVRLFDIDGDLTDSTISFFQRAPGTELDDPASDRWRIGGEVRNTQINAQRPMGDFLAGAFVDSTFSVGSNELLGFDADADSFFDDSFGIRAFEIAGLGFGQTAFADSFVLAPFIDQLWIAHPEPNNSGEPFGVTAGEIGRLTIERNGERDDYLPFRSFRPLDGDFEIRVDFEAAPEQI